MRITQYDLDTGVYESGDVSAAAVVPVLICTIFEPESGILSPASA